jgi:hypothetical protein
MLTESDPLLASPRPISAAVAKRSSVSTMLVSKRPGETTLPRPFLHELSCPWRKV